MEVFEISDLPLWMVTILCGWWSSSLGGEFSLVGVPPPWGRAGLHKECWSNSIAYSENDSA